ncbi:MAG: hypothetical protein V1870_00125 [Candidatus Aenigmatarchaeota archaeon]
MKSFSRNSKRNQRKQFIDKGLLRRFRIYMVFLFIFLAVIVYDIFTNVIGLPLLVVGIAIGIAVGFFVGRMFDIRWHEENSKVISRMDKIGVVIIVVYLIFAVFRNQIFSLWIAGPTAGAFGFCFIAGMFIGRIWRMHIVISNILHDRGLVNKTS